MTQYKKEKFKFPIPEDGLPWQILQEKNDDNISSLKNDEEGELSVDVYQTEKELIVKTAVAGVKKEDLNISLDNDMLTIRGNKKTDETIEEGNYFHQECYWGKFSRSLILPVEVDKNKVKAELKNGVLTIILPKSTNGSGIIKIKEVE